MRHQRHDLHDDLTPAAERRAWPHTAVRLALAAFFLGAVAYKLVHAGEFWVAAHKLWPLRLLPPALRDAVVGSAVGLEALAAIALVVRPWVRHGALLCLALLVVFTAVVAPQYDGCACTWQIEPLVPGSTAGLLLRNALLAAAALYVAARSAGAGAPRRARGRAVEATAPR